MEVLSKFLKENLNLPDRLVSKVKPYFNEESLSKNNYFCVANQRCKKLSLIASGYLRFYSNSDSKEVTHWIFGQGHLITDVGSFFLNEPAKWNINSLAHTTLFTLTKEKYKQLKDDVPEWKDYENLFLIKLMSALENRIYTLISMSTDQRYNYLFESDKQMFKEIPLQYIASMLGMSPETLSRIRSK